MNYALVLNLLGRLLAVEAGLMMPSLFVALADGGRDALAFAYSIILALAAGLLLILFFRPRERELHAYEGLVVVGLAWALLSAFGALPFMFSGAAGYFWDAYFETVSGFTTTGATIFSQVEQFGKGILFWRSFTHWVGGMGILILTLAVMPKLGARSAFLARAESPGPTFSRMLPRMRDTARVLYAIYAVMTLLLTGLLMLSGLPLFDAAIHALGTAGTGGFSNRNLSVGAYNNVAAEILITVFMFLFGTNFIVYFRLLKGEGIKALRHEEIRTYYLIGLVAIAVITLNTTAHYGDAATALRHASFQVASIMSTTGFSTSDFDLWPQFSRILLVLLMLIGACAGSTGGGIKVSRIMLMGKSAGREIGHTVRPRHVKTIKLEGRLVDAETLHSVMVFFIIYVFFLLLGTLLASLDGVNFTTSFSATASCLSNIGPGLSLVGPMESYGHFSPGVKYMFSGLMLLGRLEFIPLLVLFHPAVWRRAH
ncbi:MAG: TrkH family potassium uptake protein [Eubacteriales bacterium]|nr:TrkH family potassium uptake protein [Eubacteriales bacterium]